MCQVCPDSIDMPGELVYIGMRESMPRHESKKIQVALKILAEFEVHGFTWLMHNKSNM